VKRNRSKYLAMSLHDSVLGPKCTKDTNLMSQESRYYHMCADYAIATHNADAVWQFAERRFFSILVLVSISD